jgi:6-phosphofructokinase 1
MNATLKYIDPAYMIRTVPANSYDRKLCAHLAASAVHGAMAGFTSFTVGHINQSVAMIPISSLGKPSRITE